MLIICVYVGALVNACAGAFISEFACSLNPNAALWINGGLHYVIGLPCCVTRVTPDVTLA